MQRGEAANFFKDGPTAEFMRATYRPRVMGVLHSIYTLEFPEYVALEGLCEPTVVDRFRQISSDVPGIKWRH